MSRMTSKGQITIPKDVRTALGLKPGDEVDFVQNKGVIQLRRKVDAEAFMAAIERARKALVPDAFEMSVDEIMEELRGPALTPEELEELGQDTEEARRILREIRGR